MTQEPGRIRNKDKAYILNIFLKSFTHLLKNKKLLIHVRIHYTFNAKNVTLQATANFNFLKVIKN